MKKKKSFFARKTTALALAFAVSMTGTAGNMPIRTQAASSSFTLTSKVTIGDGETYQLTTKGNTKGISFQSSNKKIVTVSKTGKIKGKKSGKATIIAKVDKKSKKCTVTVKKAPKAVKIQNGNLELYTESMEQLSVKFTDGYSKKVTFQSANKAVATVSSKGLVTAVGEGKTTITATTFNGKKAKISCVVIDDQKETATSTPTNTAVPSPTTDATASAGPTASTPVMPTETTSVTEAPSNTPIATATNAPTEAPTTTPVITPDPTSDTPATSSPAPTEQATAVPSNTPTANPVTGPAISPTASADVPEIVTTSAVVSKIENGTIYIDDNTAELQLTDCIRFYKDNYEITMGEILAGDTITITYSGFMLDRHPAVFVDCEKIEVTKSRSRLVSPRTIRNVSEMHLTLHDDYISPLTYEPSETKVFKNGKEIPFSELKAGDTVRVNYTYHGSDDKEGAAGFCETLDTVVVLEDEFPDARTVTGVINSITKSSYEGSNIYYVAFDNEFYVAVCDNDTIIKVKNEKTEFATNRSALQIGQTITVSYMDQSYDMLPVWLTACKKIVVDTTVPIATPTVEPSNSPVPSSDPTRPPLPSVAPAKPVIYLYPEKETSVSVDLDFHGSFTYTYPYTKDGHWDVVAKPDGTLTNKADGKEYSYLFWEGVTSEFTPDFSEGFCVKGEDTTAFLQKVLPEMGLTPKEYNEFIVYWAPLLQNNPYNLISFQTKNYEEMAPLQINPAPDSMLRVYMAYTPLTEPVTIPEQTFTPFDRNGFTVVEWGGCMVDSVN